MHSRMTELFRSGLYDLLVSSKYLTNTSINNQQFYTSTYMCMYRGYLRPYTTLGVNVILDLCLHLELEVQNFIIHLKHKN